MKAKEAKIRELTEHLLTGQLCFLNTETGDFNSYPAEMDFLTDEENPWQEEIIKIENNSDNYN